MDSRLATYFAVQYEWNDCLLDPKNCLESVVNAFRPYLKTGHNEFNLPVIDPLKMPSFNYNLRIAKCAGTITTQNMYVENTSKFKVKEAILDTHNRTFTVDVVFPKLKIVSECLVNIKVFNKTRYFNGKLTADAKNFEMRVVFKIDKDHKKLGHIQEIKLKQNIEDYQVNFEFENSHGINKVLNGLLNKNRKHYINAIMPIVHKKSDVIFIDIIRSVLKSNPFQNLLSVA